MLTLAQAFTGCILEYQINPLFRVGTSYTKNVFFLLPKQIFKNLNPRIQKPAKWDSVRRMGTYTSIYKVQPLVSVSLPVVPTVCKLDKQTHIYIGISVTKGMSCTYIWPQHFMCSF